MTEMSYASWPGILAEPQAQALYLHVPFCVHKCAYCDFASWETPHGDDLMVAYERALELQFEEALSAGLLDPKTAYIGGGTPSMLGQDLAKLVGRIAREFQLHEFTSEANPESLSPDLIGQLAAAGLTRLSLGVQSFCDQELLALGRAHSAQTAMACVRAAQNAQLRVSIDLMCATPQQTDASWEDTLHKACELGVSHVSIYPLIIEDNTPLAVLAEHEGAPWNTSDIQADRMLTAEKILQAHGLSRYEVASYAARGQASEHNCAYWTARPYLGLGTAASSMLTRAAYERLRAVAPQLPKLPKDAARARLTCKTGRKKLVAAPTLKDQHYTVEFLNLEQACAEDLMLAMRMSAGVCPELAQSAQKIFGARYYEMVEDVIQRGLAEEQPDASLVPTERGWLLGNELFGACWELAVGTIDEISC